MNKTYRDFTPEEQQYRRNAVIICMVSVLVLAAIGAIRFFTAEQIAGPLIIIVSTLVAVGCAFASYRGHYLWATRVLFVSNLVFIPIIAFLIDGSGVVGAVLGVVVGSTEAILTRPQNKAVRWIGAFAVAGLAAVLIDFYGPPARFEVGNPTVLNYIMLGTAVVYSIFIIHQFPKFSLRAKLISATALVAVVSVVTVTAVVSITTRNALIDQVGNNLNSLADTEALAIGELMARQINLIETVAINKFVVTAVQAKNGTYEGDSPEEIQANLEELDTQWRGADSTDRLVLSIMNNTTSEELVAFRQLFPDHSKLILTDKYGGLVAASDRPNQYDFSQEAWWIDAVADGFGSVHISEPYEDLDTGKPIVNIAVPMLVQNNLGRTSIGGVLFTTFQLAPLAAILERTKTDETRHLEIHFNEGVELGVAQYEGYSDTIYELKTAEAEEVEAFDQFKNADVTYQVSEVDGESGIVASSFINTLTYEPRVDRLGWAILAFADDSTAFLPVQQVQQTNVLLGVFIVALATITAALIAQILARPIVRLTDTAVQVADGDLTARAVVESNDEIGTLATAFNRMTGQLQESIGGLEQRVAERTRALTASVEVSRSLSTVLDPDQLVVEVVEQVRAAFGYYYVQIYLYDDAQLNMAGGTGEAGQILLARGHALAAGQGLVGRAALTNSPVFIPDVSQAVDWKANALLPDTKAEVAVPIAVGDQVLGVLDVQHDVSNGLVEEDVQVLQSVAYQVAIAIQNAQSFDQARKRAEREAAINAINQKIQTAVSVDEVLQIATRELAQTLGTAQTIVQIHSPIRQPAGNGEDHLS